ncbi:Reverse transcriptase RNA-dependent DNA polymerase [Trinorchestia longiramus]|nr:Reverse transcriptase RNA-dependent DNA polymerase [Trinorchestia longiramus]
MSDEMAALVDNEAFELVAKPKERSVIGGRWVYSVKAGPNDQEIFKARYVAKGYSQVADVDFTETFSPTARLTSVRMLMDIAVQKSYIVHQMDVCTAYLHAKIDCNVFVEQPEGFIELDKNGEKLVYKLKKSLYGLKQSGRNWNNLLHQFLVEQNFVQSLSYTCVYVRESDSGKVIIIVWVDDLILASSNAVVLREVLLRLVVATLRSPRQRLLLTNNQRATCTCASSRAHNHSNDTYTTGLNPQLTLPRIISPSSSGVAVEVPITNLYIMPQEVKRLSSNKFKMKDLGPISCFLGIEFVVKQDSIEMKQSKFRERVIFRCNNFVGDVLRGEVIQSAS